MSKTKIVVKEDQILVDVEWIFDEIKEAGGDWKKVKEMMEMLLESVQETD